MHEWLALRRNGQDFEHTPIGFVTAGKPLTENHPFFRAFGQGDGDAGHRLQIARTTSGHAGDGQEDDDFVDEDDDFVPAAEPVDDSESEDEARASDEEAGFFDAVEDIE